MSHASKIYLIDLDNCLYNSKEAAYLVNTFETRITNWLVRKLECSFSKAEKKKAQLYHRFGGAPKCFIKASIIKSKDELIKCVDFIHDFRVCSVSKNPNLRRKLLELNGDLYLFTSSHVNYATQMLVALGISDLFTDIIDISKVRYTFKDEKITYERVFRLLNTLPNKIVMIDDSFKNLLVGAEVGIKQCICVNHEGSKQQPSNSIRFIANIMDL